MNSRNSLYFGTIYLTVYILGLKQHYKLTRSKGFEPVTAVTVLIRHVKSGGHGGVALPPIVIGKFNCAWKIKHYTWKNAVWC